MNNYIVLLRGINVGGHRKVPMAEIRSLLIKIGFVSVKTYIQSGNIVLKSNIESTKIIETKIQESIKENFGFEISVLVKTPIQFEEIFNKSPFKNEVLEKSYFMILDAKPSDNGLDEVKNLNFKDEEFYITDNCIYLFCKNGYGRTKFNSNFFERKLNLNATARNYKTMLKLVTMATETHN